jgi:hypothetical protein
VSLIFSRRRSSRRQWKDACRAALASSVSLTCPRPGLTSGARLDSRRRRRRKERSALARLSSRDGLIRPSRNGSCVEVRTLKGRSKPGAVARGKQQPWKRKFAARDFWRDGRELPLRIAGPPTEAGPCLGKLRKYRAILRTRKPRRFARIRNDGHRSSRRVEEPCHVGYGPGLVDEDQPRGIDVLLAALPTRSVTRYVRTIPLARDERLFLSVTPNRFQGRHVNYHSDGARDGTRLIGLDRA